MTNREKLRELFPCLNIIGTVFMDKHTEQVLATSVNFNWLDAEYKEPTTKNNLAVDYIDRAQAQTEIEMNAFRYTLAKERGGMGQVEWSDLLIKVSDAVDIIRNLPSATPQEPQTFKWCTTCKEYDQEKHCCHRWSKVIRNTVEELKQEYIEREVLDKIRAEIRKKMQFNSFNEGYVLYDDITEVFDKYKAENNS